MTLPKTLDNFGLLQISKMDQRDEDLLDKQLWGVSPTPPRKDSLVSVAFLAVLLVGIAIGGALFANDSKQIRTPPHDVTAALSLLKGTPPPIR